MPSRIARSRALREIPAGEHEAAGGSTWVEEPGVLGDCAMYLPVYCFENTRRVRVTPRSEKTKLAFLSSPWRPGGGVDAADRHCTEEAQAHGLTGTYVAAVHDALPDLQETR